MSSVRYRFPMVEPEPARARANALADVLEKGACELIEFASGLSDEEWQTRVPHDERKIGVVVHHVAAIYPVEIKLALVLAGGTPITGLTWEDVHAMNAEHAKQFDRVTKEEALDLLRKNSAAAAAAIRTLTDEKLDWFCPISMYSDAPLTCQFMLEDHSVRHSYHHLARIRAALKR